MVWIGAIGLVGLLLAYGMVTLAAVLACGLAPLGCASLHLAVDLAGQLDPGSARTDVQLGVHPNHVDLFPWTFAACWLLAFLVAAVAFGTVHRRARS